MKIEKKTGSPYKTAILGFYPYLLDLFVHPRPHPPVLPPLDFVISTHAPSDWFTG
jgi:hypothetical protein